MRAVALVCAPLMSVVRPSLALGLLQATLAARGIAVRCVYSNLLFAERIGLDLNEAVAETLPTDLLAGEWLFAAEAGCGGSPATTQAHEADMAVALRRRGIPDLGPIRDAIVPAFLDEAVDTIMADRPAIVGFTTMFAQTLASVAIAARIKARAPETLICFGGPNCHGPMGGVLLKAFDVIDVVFTGEADVGFPDFVAAVMAGRTPARDGSWIGRVAGPAAPRAPVTQDLDRLPTPDFGDYFGQLGALSAAARIRPSLPFESSRGCWWGQKHHCTFCGLNATGMAYRQKSTERVLGELDELRRRYGIRQLAATDNILSLKHLRDVMPRLAKAGEPTRMFYEVKANLDEAELKLLADAGVSWLQPGIESLSDGALRLMRKGTTSLINIRLLRQCREFGIGVSWSLLYGFPGEPVSEYDEVAAFAPLLEHLQPPFGCGRIRLDRFSPNFEDASALGFVDVRPAPAYAAVYGLGEGDLRDLAYFFVGAAPEAARDDDMSPLREAAARWRARWTGDPEVPRLQAMATDAGLLVEDTRSCAAQRFSILSPIESALLVRCRSPRASADLAAVAPDRVGDVEDGLADLIHRGFVIERGGIFLSLVVTAGRECFGPDDWAGPPLGFVLPATEESAPCP
ncbi:RiPP maturation radical SAM C-methyltransferase [Lichenibacterium dinghuense]|uniref:RiPP maturation radical SAM C-methyltransferase n=1 Tax=Lichenibacterium dinghuense TaxID=2895977 RepID=UPI001F02E27B|nr:RiPP maturation radical SAM C-methyltransferase [Lichenibacterium sp. 6Y81]